MEKTSFMRSFWNFIKSRSFFKHFGLVILFYLVVIFGTIFLLDWSTNHGEKIEVPNVVGKNANEAKSILEEKGLKYQILDSIYNPNKPNGTVIDQTPGPTKSTSVYVKSGRIIGLRVTKKQKLVEVPNLINKSQKFAQSVLINRGLKFIVRYKPVPQFGGLVVEQLYNGKKVIQGTKIPVGATITVYIGEVVKEDNEKIPDLYGLTIREAIEVLDGLGFRYIYGCVDCDENSDTLSAIVISQSPEYNRGKEMSKSNEITFTGAMEAEVDEEKISRSKANQEMFNKEREELEKEESKNKDKESGSSKKDTDKKSGGQEAKKKSSGRKDDD